MPPQPLLDITTLDPAKPVISKDEIYSLLPHRYEFERLDGILHIDLESKLLAGYKYLDEQEFWIRGHIPGRPLFPGVMMIETAAQLVSYGAMKLMEGDGFLGFAAVDDVKFRGSVQPGDTVLMIGKMVEVRKRRCIGQTQAFVNDKMVYEGLITGMWL
jgi:3-hydroxyacyl-[acyl-carrier-protein] dehydratase